jgi:hypothetical protein
MPQLHSSKIRRLLIVLLALSAALLAPAALALRWPGVAAVVRELPIGAGLDPTPRPPVIAAPAGPLPDGVAGLQERAQTSGQGYHGLGSGFFLRLLSGPIIGVTTAHSVAALGQPGNNLQNMAWALPGARDTEAGNVDEFSSLYGLTGLPFSGTDLSVDYLLLKTRRLTRVSLALVPDERGAPQPGERVALYSGLGGAEPARRVRMGTVLSSAGTAAWLRLDDSFHPGGMSGSPVLGAYTGRVVGMAVAATHQRGRVLIGLNPIGAIVQHAAAAKSFPSIAEFTH